MNPTIKIKRSDESAKVALLGFPQYRGRKIVIEVHEAPYSFSFGENYWDGGSRREYALVALDSEATIPIPTATPVHNPDIHAMLTETGLIPPNVAVVEHEVFQGVDCGLRIHVRDENVARALPVPERGSRAA